MSLHPSSNFRLGDVLLAVLFFSSSVVAATAPPEDPSCPSVAGAFSDTQSLDRRTLFVAAVQQEIAARAADPTFRLTSNKGFAERFGAKEHTIARWLSGALTPEVGEARKRALIDQRTKDLSDRFADKRDAVVAFVRAELEARKEDPDAPLTTTKDLSARLGVDQGAAADWIAQALGPETDRARKEVIFVAAGKKNSATIQAKNEPIRQAIRDEIARELDEVASKKREKISSQRELAARHGVAQDLVTEALAALQGPVRKRYEEVSTKQAHDVRLEVLHAERRERREEVIAVVQAEIAAHRADKAQPLSTNEQLAARFGYDATTTLTRVMRDLPKAERAYRKREIIRQGIDRRESTAGIPKLPPGTREERRNAMRGELSRQIAARRDDPNAELPSVSQLATKHKIEMEDAVAEWEKLPEGDRDFYAEIKLAEKRERDRAKGLKPHLENIDKVATSVAAEFAEFKAGKRKRVRTNQEVGRDFGIHHQTVPKWLAEKMSAAEIAERREQILQQAAEKQNAARRQNGPYMHDGLGYDSKSEAAFAVLLARHTAGFVPKDGETVHVRMARKEADFLLGKRFIEYHPIVLAPPPGDLPDAAAYGAYKAEAKKRTKGPERDAYRLEVTAALEEEYADERHDALAKSEWNGKGYEMVVVHSVDQFYDALVSTPGVKLPPKLTREAFRKEFEAEMQRLPGRREAAAAEAKPNPSAPSLPSSAP